LHVPSGFTFAPGLDSAIDEGRVDCGALKGIESAVPPLALEHLAVWWDMNDSAGLAAVPPDFGAEVEQVDEELAAGAVPARLPDGKATIRCRLANVAFEIEALIALEVIAGARSPSLARGGTIKLFASSRASRVSAWFLYR
jgi:hypothetical protein